MYKNPGNKIPLIAAAIVSLFLIVPAAFASECADFSGRYKGGQGCSNLHIVGASAHKYISDDGFEQERRMYIDSGAEVIIQQKGCEDFTFIVTNEDDRVLTSSLDIETIDNHGRNKRRSGGWNQSMTELTLSYFRKIPGGIGFDPITGLSLDTRNTEREEQRFELTGSGVEIQFVSKPLGNRAKKGTCTLERI